MPLPLNPEINVIIGIIFITVLCSFSIYRPSQDADVIRPVLIMFHSVTFLSVALQTEANTLDIHVN